MTERFTILNLQATRRQPLIAAARRLASEEPHGSALIVAQAATSWMRSANLEELRSPSSWSAVFRRIALANSLSR